MKHISKFLLLTIFMVSALFSCKKDEVKIFLENSTAPVVTSTASGTVPLNFATKDIEATKLSWTNPNYTFTTGISSQDVSYEIQIDTTGANFTNPKKKSLSIKNDLSYSFTQSELNDYLLNTLELLPGMVHNIEFRVKSTLINSSAPLFSNVIKLKATPYAIPPKVAPPQNLFIVGSATPGGWNNPVPVPSQQFTKLSPTKFEMTLNLSGGNFYLLLPVNGSWDAKFGALGGNGSNNPTGDDFKAGGGDMVSPAASGKYKITIDFQTGKFKLTLI